MRPFYPILDRVWDDYENHIKTLHPNNHAEGLADQMSVENLRDNTGTYALLDKEVRAFRKLRSKERVEACAKYLVMRFPKVYELVPGTRNGVRPRYHTVAPPVPKIDDSKQFIVRIPCRILNHYNFADEPMDLDIEVAADNAYEAARMVELALRGVILTGGR